MEAVFTQATIQWKMDFIKRLNILQDIIDKYGDVLGRLPYAEAKDKIITIQKIRYSVRIGFTPEQDVSARERDEYEENLTRAYSKFIAAM